MKLWRTVHYSLGIGGTLSALLVAAQPRFLQQPVLEGLAWLAAACVALLTALRPHGRGNAYAAAWRILSDACNRYSLDEDFGVNALLDAAAKGERIIQASDPAS